MTGRTSFNSPVSRITLGLLHDTGWVMIQVHANRLILAIMHTHAGGMCQIMNMLKPLPGEEEQGVAFYMGAAWNTSTVK